MVPSISAVSCHRRSAIGFICGSVTTLGPRRSIEVVMEDHLPEELAQVVTRVKEVLWDLPGPVYTPPHAFFDVDNLWKIEIPSTCRQAIEYVRGVMLLIDEGMNRPAAALSRSVHECYIRFEYLSSHEDELPDWFEWQMSREYHAASDTQRHFDRLPAAHVGRQQERMEEIEVLLGRAPSKPNNQWKSAPSMLQDVASRFGTETYGPLYRQLLADPSDYVHVHGSIGPSWMAIMRLTEISFSLIIKRAMQLCTSKRWLGSPGC